jgi:hypothetical protein
MTERHNQIGDKHRHRQTEKEKGEGECIGCF